jgi:hypothetical protein
MVLRIIPWRVTPWKKLVLKGPSKLLSASIVAVVRAKAKAVVEVETPTTVANGEVAKTMAVARVTTVARTTAMVGAVVKTMAEVRVRTVVDAVMLGLAGVTMQLLDTTVVVMATIEAGSPSPPSLSRWWIDLPQRLYTTSRAESSGSMP